MISFAAPLSSLRRRGASSSAPASPAHARPQPCGAPSMCAGTGGSGYVGCGVWCVGGALCDGLWRERYSESRLFTNTVRNESDVSVNACAHTVSSVQM